MRYEEISNDCSFCGGQCSGYKSFVEECLICGASFTWRSDAGPDEPDGGDGWYRELVSGPSVSALDIIDRLNRWQSGEYVESVESIGLANSVILQMRKKDNNSEEQ